MLSIVLIQTCSTGETTLRSQRALTAMGVYMRPSPIRTMANMHSSATITTVVTILNQSYNLTARALTGPQNLSKQPLRGLYAREIAVLVLMVVIQPVFKITGYFAPNTFTNQGLPLDTSFPYYLS